MESFNRREHVVAAFLDVEKAFDNVWHNGLRYKIFMLDLPTKMTRWLSDFLVGRVIQVNVNGFLSDQINPAAGVQYNNTTNKYKYKCLDRATTMPQEDFLMGPVVKKLLVKIPYINTKIMPKLI